MSKLFDRRNISADEVLNMTWADSYRIERNIKEDLDQYER
jgi:hypothetical protein